MTSKVAQFFQNGLDAISNSLADIFENGNIQVQAQRLLDIFLDSAIRMFTIVFILSVTLTIGPSIESRFLGVLVSWSASDFKPSPDGEGWDFEVFAIKPWWRANCSYIKDQQIDARAVIPSPVAGGEDITVPGILAIRKTGKLVKTDDTENREYFGHWAFTAEQPIPVGSVIYGTMKHQCHILWVSTTVFGPFEVRVPHTGNSLP